MFIGIMFYFMSMNQHSQPAPVPTRTSTSTPTNTVSSSSAIVPVEFVVGQQSPSDSFQATYIETSTQTFVSFKGVPGGYRTQTTNVFVNGKKVGRTGGDFIMVTGFSPNGRYFAFRMTQTIGLIDTVVSIIDLPATATTTTPQVSFWLGGPSVTPKVNSRPYPTDQFPGSTLYPYIGTVSWEKDNTLDVSSYYLFRYYNNASHTMTYYRASPEETWRYDLTTGSSTLIQATP